MQSMDSIETFAYSINKNLICEKVEFNNLKKQYKND